jgi:hypothetical protein
MGVPGSAEKQKGMMGKQAAFSAMSDNPGDLNRSTQHRRHTTLPGFELQGLAGRLLRWCAA